ncbi:MAG: TetR/AcrR family transcriptional regulator C-terminal domain-containing protein [Actinomycetota bacterium]
MAKETKSRPGRRRPLSRERVLRAAIKLADEGGIEALSMRKLAKELGVEAMSLYNHVANKNDVLDAIMDAAWGEVVVPTGEADWKTEIREIAISVHEALLRHPWVPALRMRQKPGPARLRYGDSLLGCLRNAGFSKDQTYHGYHIIESYIMGYTDQVLSYLAVDPEQFGDIAASFARGELAAEFPHFTEHALQHMEDDHDDVNAYELGLDLLLDGLEKLRDSA